MRALGRGMSPLVVILAVAAMTGCGTAGETGKPPVSNRPAKVESKGAAPSDGGLADAAEAHWPKIVGGHYVRWVGRVWNTRKRANIRQSGKIGTLGRRNGTGTYLGEDRVNAGAVEFDVRFDSGYGNWEPSQHNT